VTADEALAVLEKQGTRRTREGMSRYGIVAKRAFGVTMAQLLAMRKRIGVDQELSLALWKSGWYEARLLAALVGDPARVTRRQMDAWARGFENWGDCDTVCFKLFDRVPFAWEKAAAWALSPREYTRRGGYVLMACLAAHDSSAPQARFEAFLPLIEAGARDERNFVKKGVSWALRMIGRRSMALNKSSLALARRLEKSDSESARWIGKGAARELQGPVVRAVLARRA
jgi:3-methyladenine DNA glycosylase AlkD